MQVSSSDPRENHRVIDDSEYIEDDKTAKARYAKWQAIDPFPDIQPSLLHSGQILDYILKTGMLSPFGPEDCKGIKPASVEIPFEGQVVYWDEDQIKWDHEIIAGAHSPRTDFTLRRNSIAFVQVRPKFRLPYYIAVRFNLKITHVYRGLLLGTGPLVDPGYQGNLYIPLHNLTNNDYHFKAGEGLLWMEFTKLQWADNGRNEIDQETAISDSKFPEGYKPFPQKKTNLPLHSFFEKANKNCPIPSSIPQEIKKANEASERSANASEASAHAAKESARQVGFFSKVGTVGVLGVIIALGVLFFNTWSLMSEVRKEIGSGRIDLRHEIKVLSDQFENELMDLRAQIDRIEDQSVEGGVGSESVEE